MQRNSRWGVGWGRGRPCRQSGELREKGPRVQLNLQYRANKLHQTWQIYRSHNTLSSSPPPKKKIGVSWITTQPVTDGADATVHVRVWFLGQKEIQFSKAKHRWIYSSRDKLAAFKRRFRLFLAQYKLFPGKIIKGWTKIQLSRQLCKEKLLYSNTVDVVCIS